VVSGGGGHEEGSFDDEWMLWDWTGWEFDEGCCCEG